MSNLPQGRGPLLTLDPGAEPGSARTPAVAGPVPATVPNTHIHQNRQPWGSAGDGDRSTKGPVPPVGSPIQPPTPQRSEGHPQSGAVMDPLPRDALSKGDGGAGEPPPQPLTSRNTTSPPNPPPLRPQTWPRQPRGVPKDRAGPGVGCPPGLEKLAR